MRDGWKFLFCIVLGYVSVIFAQSSQSFDLIITNGHVIDGTGSPWYSADRSPTSSCPRVPPGRRG